MARVLEEIPQEMEESTETDAMLGSTQVAQRCSRSSVGFAFLGLSMLAMVLALALPKENHLRKSHESVIGLNDDDIWASVLSDHAMEQLHQQQAKLDDAKDKASSSAQQVQKSANDVVSNLNHLLTKPKEEVKKAVKTAPQVQEHIDLNPHHYINFDDVKKQTQTLATMEKNPMDAVQSAADEMKDVLNLGMPKAPAPAAPAPVAPAISVPAVQLPPAPKIQLPPMPTMAPPHSIENMGSEASSKANKMKEMADSFMQEASKAGLTPQQKAQLQSLANMLKKDAGKVGGTASAAAAPLATGLASVASAAPVAPPAVPAVQTVTDNPKDSPLAPQESDKSGDPCVDDEEDFGGLCYKKCSILSGGSHPCRSSAWSCCAVPDGPACQAKASFGNCWLHIGFCGGYSVAGDAEAAGGNSCPTGEGGCLTNEEMFGTQCYKKCSLLSPQFPYRVGPSSCCSKTGGFDCFWPSNLHTDSQFNVGGGEGDKNSGTPSTAHSPMLQLSQ